MKQSGNPNQGTTTKKPAYVTVPIGNWDLYTDDGGMPEPSSERDNVTAPPMRPYVADLPNFNQINALSAIDVAKKIGWEVVNVWKRKKFVEEIVCPRSSEHGPGKSPYLKVLPSNNKVVCEACDTFPLSVLDMVQDFGGYKTLREAAEYVAGYYPDLPRKAKASYLKNPKVEPVPPGCRDPWILLISSGIYAELSVSSQRLIPVLLERANWKDNGPECLLRLSERAMMQFSGIGSYTGIGEALTELNAIGFLEKLLAPRRANSPERETGVYRLTPLSPRLKQLADNNCPKFGETIYQEKAIARQKRKERDRKRRLGI
jgi:hypothetical protein